MLAARTRAHAPAGVNLAVVIDGVMVSDPKLLSFFLSMDVEEATFINDNDSQ